MIPGGEPMRPQVFLSAWATLTLGAATASAAGINLGWNDCPGGATYALTETFACNTNVGVHTMVGSFVAPAGVQMMSANEVVIDLKTGPGFALADWWKMGSGRCRPTSLGSNFDFTGGPFSCHDYWQGGAIGAAQEDPPNGFDNRARIKMVFAVPAGDPRITSVAEGLHVYSFKLNINNSRTVGLGSCAGCNAEACIALQTIRLNQPVPFPRIDLTNPSTVAHVIWQAWTTVDPNHLCPSVTPVKSQTWGSIKALYR
jgi:hypothetical protein